MYESARRALTQVSASGAFAFSPLWTPDGRALLHVIETPVYDVARVFMDGTGSDTVIRSGLDKMLGATTPDGRIVAYFEIGGLERLRFAPLVAGASLPEASTTVPMRNPAFSPDGRWLVVEELVPGKSADVFVRPVAGTGRRQVSVDGGNQPRFTRGGREIVFRRGAEMLAAAFDPATGEVGTPSVLFRRRDIGRGGSSRTTGYDVTPDGNRFLIVEPVPRVGEPIVAVITNWIPELRKAMRR
jgi:Tol biopolymer transport system component